MKPAIPDPGWQVIVEADSFKKLSTFPRNPAHHGICKACQPVKAKATHKLDRAVDGGMRPGIEEQQLRNAEAQNFDGVPASPRRTLRQHLVEDVVDLPSATQNCRYQHPDEGAIALRLVVG